MPLDHHYEVLFLSDAMSLWTPYADQALDLSRAAVKQERLSPATERLDATFCYNCDSSHHSYTSMPRSPENWSKLVPSPPQSPQLYDIESLSEDLEYQAFERDALRAMAERNGGSLLGNNPRMRRAVQSSNGTADDSYRKQRERNNHAAKQSRDRRKLREVRLAFQVTFLRKKVAALRARVGEGCCNRCRQECQC